MGGFSAPACSSDNFAVRPQSFIISSSDATNSANAGVPVIVAGDPFNLSAAAVNGYSGIPLIDSSLIVGTPIAGVLTGVFPAATAGTGRSSSDDFRYSEVGHIGLGEYAVYDTAFTSVDHPHDCRTGFSNTLSGGQYGCSFGSGSTGNSAFGRFIPAYFLIAANAPLLDHGCSGFTYLGQSFEYLIDPQFTLTAYNRNSVVTNNYGGQYWKMSSLLPQRFYDNNAATLANLSVVNTGTVTWSDTADSDGDGIVTITGERLVYSKPVLSEAPFTTNVDLVVPADNLTDSDGVCYDLGANGSCDAFTISSILGGEQRFGRLLLQNAYGPETLPLNIRLVTEFFNGTAFVPNISDTCTSYDVVNLKLGPYQGNLVEDETTATGAGNVDAGVGTNLQLSAPGIGNDGSVHLTLDLSLANGADMEWLRPGGVNPTATATFGIFRGNPRLIYMRESIW